MSGQVSYIVNGVILLQGTLEYVNLNGWVGILDSSGVLYECDGQYVEVAPEK